MPFPEKLGREKIDKLLNRVRLDHPESQHNQSPGWIWFHHQFLLSSFDF